VSQAPSHATTPDDRLLDGRPFFSHQRVFKIDNSRSNGDTTYGNSLINCQFQYLGDNAFKGSSAGVTVDNILICQAQMTTLGSDSRSVSFDSPRIVRGGDTSWWVRMEKGVQHGIYI